MAERKLTLKKINGELIVSEFDHEKEVPLSVSIGTDCYKTIYLNRDDLCYLRQHIEYLLAKT